MFCTLLAGAAAERPGRGAGQRQRPAQGSHGDNVTTSLLAELGCTPWIQVCNLKPEGMGSGPPAGQDRIFKPKGRAKKLKQSFSCRER